MPCQLKLEYIFYYTFNVRRTFFRKAMEKGNITKLQFNALEISIVNGKIAKFLMVFCMLYFVHIYQKQNTSNSNKIQAAYQYLPEWMPAYPIYRIR